MLLTTHDLSASKRLPPRSSSTAGVFDGRWRSFQPHPAAHVGRVSTPDASLALGRILDRDASHRYRVEIDRRLHAPAAISQRSSTASTADSREEPQIEEVVKRIHKEGPGMS